MLRKSLWVFAALLTSGSVLAGGANLPHRYSAAARDRGLIQIANAVDGRVWSVWAFRSGTEYDIAISLRNQDGSWGEPTFIGREDARTEVQPSLAVDSNGTLHMAFVVWETGQIMLASLPRGATVWSTPVQAVLEPGRHSAPKLLVLGGQLVIAYRSVQGTGIATVPIGNPTPLGIEDGPDGWPLPITGDQGLHPN